MDTEFKPGVLLSALRKSKLIPLVFSVLINPLTEVTAGLECKQTLVKKGETSWNLGSVPSNRKNLPVPRVGCEPRLLI